MLVFADICDCSCGCGYSSGCGGCGIMVVMGATSLYPDTHDGFPSLYGTRRRWFEVSLSKHTNIILSPRNGFYCVRGKIN